MTFNENALWRDEMNLRLSKLPSTKVLLKLEFDTEDQVLFAMYFRRKISGETFLRTKRQLRYCIFGAWKAFSN